MPAKRIRVAASSEVREGKLLATQVEGRKLVLSRIGGKVCAAVDRCPHMGLSLAKGKIENGVVTCPWHNSRFDFCSGRNMDWASAILGVPMPKWTHKALAMGRAPAPLTTTAAAEINGDVFVFDLMDRFDKAPRNRHFVACGFATRPDFKSVESKSTVAIKPQ